MRNNGLRDYLRWLGIVALGIVCINLFGCVASVPIVPVEFSSPMQLGQVVCTIDGQPVIFVATRAPKEEMPFVLIHESKHVEQMRRSGNCKKQSERYRVDQEFRLQQESEAYCADILARVSRQGKDKAVLKQRAAVMLTMYSVGKTAADIEAQLPC